MNFALPFFKNTSIKWDNFFQLYREPVATFCITPNNAPEIKHIHYSRKQRYDDHDDFYSEEQSINANAFFATLSGMASKFYPPERVRFYKTGIKIKINDLISYKIVIENKTMKFYLTVPKRLSDSFIGSIKRDWGQVDITHIRDDIITVKPDKSKAIQIMLRKHHALSIKYDKKGNFDPLYPALSSLAETMLPQEKLVIDFRIEPLLDAYWKGVARRVYDKFKKGANPTRDEKSWEWVANKVFDVIDYFAKEFDNFMEDILNLNGSNSKKKDEQKINKDYQYSSDKHHENSRGSKVQIYAVAEADDTNRARHILKSVSNGFSELDGDNQFTVKHFRTKNGIKSVIDRISTNQPKLKDYIVPPPSDIFFQKELNQLIRTPNKHTLKEYKSVIAQDNFTRTEIHKDFYDPRYDAIPLAYTLDKDSKTVYMTGYEREWWSYYNEDQERKRTMGRYVIEKTKLDDRSQATLIFGQQGSGKTTLVQLQALATFAVHVEQEVLRNNPNATEDDIYNEWKKRSKSVVVFDVADGEMIVKIWNKIPEWLKKRNRVIILNHAIHERPIPVNFSELEEFNRNVMNDPDFAFELAKMEANLIKDIVKASDSLYVNNFFISALQIAHRVSSDYGVAEAIKILLDADFRLNTVTPKLIELKDEGLLFELEMYNQMDREGQTGKIISAIQNRLTQLERDKKLWDCIAQKPLRNEDGSCAINFRKWIDGDEDGAYMVLVYIPKSGISDQFREFIFAHYLVKIWNLALSREKGFAGREYRPETLVVVDEIHQVIHIPTIANMFIDLFKEPRKYSLRLMFTLHGWSSIANAGRGIESKIKQSILDNGCNLIMLKGGRDAFESLENFLAPMKVADYDNLMNMDWCGIFGIRWQNKSHVFQARMCDANEFYADHDTWDLFSLAKYNCPHSRNRDEVRKDNLERSKSMLKRAIMSNINKEEENKQEVSDDDWEDAEKDGMKGKKSRKSR